MQSRSFLVVLGLVVLLVGGSFLMYRAVYPIGGALVDSDDFSVYTADGMPQVSEPHVGLPESDLDAPSQDEEGDSAGDAVAGDGIDSSSLFDASLSLGFTDSLLPDDRPHAPADGEGDVAVASALEGGSISSTAWLDRPVTVEERGFQQQVTPAQFVPPTSEPQQPTSPAGQSDAPQVGTATSPTDISAQQESPTSSYVGAAAQASDPSAGSQAANSILVTHTVQPGETLSSIANSYGIRMESIAAINALSNPNRIRVGDSLLIPSTDGAMHTVQSGESLWSIANTYGVSVDDIVTVNQIATPDSIRVGETLFIPGIDAALAFQMGDKVVGPSGQLLPNFSWPIKNTVTSRYGMRGDRMHNGIDIRAGIGTPVRAAASGTVTIAQTGYNGGYGDLVVIDHGDGVETRYAHNSSILVRVGDRVERGQVISLSGASGNVTGPHLHFEIRYYGQAVDPLDYLR